MDKRSATSLVYSMFYTTVGVNQDGEADRMTPFGAACLALGAPARFGYGKDRKALYDFLVNLREEAALKRHLGLDDGGEVDPFRLFMPGRPGNEVLDHVLASTGVLYNHPKHGLSPRMGALARFLGDLTKALHDPEFDAQPKEQGAA